MASKPATTADKVLSTDDKERIMKMLEDDDEFEEFETHDWDVDKSVQNQYKWTVDWEDDLEEDNFMTELRAEIKKH